MQLTVLDNDGIAQIDQSARHILEKTGIEIYHEKMRILFARACARVDPGSNRVRIRRDELLAAYQPVPCEDGLDREVERLIKHAKDNLKEE
ncbi:trimethylamine methyltransferase family protein [candidate division KSB1 bacterium]|nr:trimethylamine methyltransferase family protein [candidate division KSB1 bacterium]